MNLIMVILKKKKYDNKSILLFSDTGSLMYEMKTKYVYEDFIKYKKLFDFSNYSTKTKFYDNSNKSWLIR